MADIKHKQLVITENLDTFSVLIAIVHCKYILMQRYSLPKRRFCVKTSVIYWKGTTKNILG